MRKLNPKTAQDNPLAASLLGSILVKQGREDGSQTMQESGMDLLKIAEANQDKMPTFEADSKMAKAIKAMKVKKNQG